MGFALWIEDGIAWAEGTHEYRPMGSAVISIHTHFTPRDFRPAPRHRTPMRDPWAFEGFFASIGHLNQHLEKRRRRAGSRPYNPTFANSNRLR
ncbi:MAG: hypothetical protein SFV54_25990 [Bryobacteraceae bacterium]|nr:hypothetical protein [Bryobacteraceae bacterium]